jgi:hypothetical protein
MFQRGQSSLVQIPLRQGRSRKSLVLRYLEEGICGGSQPAEFGVLLGRRVASAEGALSSNPCLAAPDSPCALESLGTGLQLLNAWEVTTARLVRQSAAASRELSNGRVLSATLDRSSGTPASPSHAIETAYRLSVSR